MQRRILTTTLAALTAAALVACSDANTPSLLSDQDLTEDLATTSGDAIATNVANLIANEQFAGLPGALSSVDGSADPTDLTVVRSRTCYDGDAVQDQCDALTTDSVVIIMSVDGSFSRQFTGRRGTELLERAVHSDHRLTISGLDGTETSRTHDGAGASDDTTTITRIAGGDEEPNFIRTLVESSLDSVQSIVFDLPRATNPWPTSGSIVRRVSGEVTVTLGDRTETRSFSRRIQVTFPADAQGNVTIQINDQTCTLNLVTRAITNCTS